MAEAIIDLRDKETEYLRDLYIEQQRRMGLVRAFKLNSAQAYHEYFAAAEMKRQVGAELRRRKQPIRKNARPSAGGTPIFMRPGRLRGTAHTGGLR